MKTLCLTVLVCFLFQGAEEKPKVLDWALIPASGDKDYKEVLVQARKEYADQKVIVTGLFQYSHTDFRSITFDLVNTVKRGDLAIHKRIPVTFRDVARSPLYALSDRKAVVKMTGILKKGGKYEFFLEDATFFIEPKVKTKPELRTKPELKKVDAEAAASAKLSLCKQLIDLDKRDTAKLRLTELVRDYPATKAAEEAKALLKKL